MYARGACYPPLSAAHGPETGVTTHQARTRRETRPRSQISRTPRVGGAKRGNGTPGSGTPRSRTPRSRTPRSGTPPEAEAAGTAAERGGGTGPN